MFKITEGAEITLALGQQIPARPKILIDSLTVILTTQNSAEAVGEEMMNAVGSTEDWLHTSRTDSFAFDADTRLLKAVSLYYPELNKVPASLNPLTAAEKMTGIPRLATHSGPFEALPLPYRHYHMEGDLLLCFDDAFLLADHLSEVAISGELSLFFSNGHHCAWGVYHPETFLTDRITEAIAYPSDSLLKASLRDAFELITDETVARMREHDGHSLQQIAALHDRIAAHGTAPGSPPVVLKDWLFNLADKFYRAEELDGLFQQRSS